MSVTVIKRDNWYSIESEFSSDLVVCGECAQEMIDDTKSGRYTGDEATYMNMLKEVADADTEPYQCDSCLSQNKAYDDADWYAG